MVMIIFRMNVRLENLVVAHIVKEFSTFQAAWNFITVFTGPSRWIRWSASLIQPANWHPKSLWLLVTFTCLIWGVVCPATLSSWRFTPCRLFTTAYLTYSWLHRTKNNSELGWLLQIYAWEVKATPNSRAAEPPLVGCPMLLVYYFRSYPPYRGPSTPFVNWGRAMAWWNWWWW